MRRRVGWTFRIAVVSLVWVLVAGAGAVWAECECGYDSCPTETCDGQCQNHACDCSPSCDCAGTRCSSADPPCTSLTRECWETGCQPTYTQSCTCEPLCNDYSTEESDLPCYSLGGVTGVPRNCTDAGIKGCDGFDCECEDTYCPAGGVFPCGVDEDSGPCRCGYPCPGSPCGWDCPATGGYPCGQNPQCNPGSCLVLGSWCSNTRNCYDGLCCTNGCAILCACLATNCGALWSGSCGSCQCP